MILRNGQAMIFALECQARFLGEKRSELYERYCSRASQLKMVPGAKKLAKSRLCRELAGWCGDRG